MPNFKSQGLKIAEVQCIRHHVYDLIDFLFVWHLPVHFPRQKFHSDSIEIHRIVKLSDEILCHTHATYFLISPHEAVHEHLCYICSFYSVTNTTSRRPAVLTLSLVKKTKKQKKTHGSFSFGTRILIKTNPWKLIFQSAARF
jgi:hypothetical protein